MLKTGSTIYLSASDLVGHLNCRHLTWLDLAVAKGELSKPSVWDPVLELLVERGAQHERGYIEHLRAGGLSIVEIEGVGIDAAAAAKTLDAMKAGTPIIVQGALQTGRWSGRADILRRVETPSALGPWSYEVVDTKLARETKGNTVLQISLYSDLLAGAQGRVPDSAFVVAPGTGFEPQEFRIADYGAYYRRVKASLERAVDGGRSGRIPRSETALRYLPVAHAMRIQAARGRPSFAGGRHFEDADRRTRQARRRHHRGAGRGSRCPCRGSPNGEPCKATSGSASRPASRSPDVHSAR